MFNSPNANAANAARAAARREICGAARRTGIGASHARYQCGCNPVPKRYSAPLTQAGNRVPSHFLSFEPMDQPPERSPHERAKFALEKIEAARAVQSEIAVDMRPKLHGHLPHVVLL